MNFVLKKMNIENFKGIRSRSITFDPTFERIEGKNGTGKTTIFSAFMWVMADRDADLKSNPAVFPLGVEECTPSVELILEIDGRPCRIKKSQTRKITIVGDVTKVAMSNSYFFNDCPLSERDLIKRLEEMDVDLTRFQELVHPSAFLLNKKDDMRKLLFDMAQCYSDKEIADMMGAEVAETAELLANYKFNEVQQMQKATLKKIDENYGKKGEILNAKIEGLESAKIEYDFSALELLKNSLEEKLTVIDSKRKQNIDNQRDLDILREKDMNLQFEISGIRNSLSAYKNDMLAKLKAECADKKSALDNKAKLYKQLKLDKETAEKRLAYAEREVEVAKDSLEKANALVWDNNSENCPTCKQKLPDDDIAKLKENFEKDRQAKIDKAKEELSDSETAVQGYKEKIEQLKAEIEQCTKDGKTIQDDYAETVNKYNEYVKIPVEEPTPELKAKEKELEEIKAKQEELKKAYIPGLDVQEVDLRSQLRDTELKLGQADTNCQIDEKILVLREKQKEYEQNRADAEKILYQLDMIQKRKFELLTADINKHFTLCKWSFFKQQKNGEWITTCDCFVDGKELGVALNTAMQIRAKIDICDSLQKFYNLHYPIWIDGGEALDSDNQEALITDTQVVILCVKD